MLIYNYRKGNNRLNKREVMNMRKVSELSMVEYIDVVVAYGQVDDFKAYCEQHDVDYADAMEYDWD